jgi:hypothetical protein
LKKQLIINIEYQIRKVDEDKKIYQYKNKKYIKEEVKYPFVFEIQNIFI